MRTLKSLSTAILLALIVLPLWESATVQAQTSLLQALIDATPPGGTLTLPPDVVYSCNCVIDKTIRIESVGERPIEAAFGKVFHVGAKVVTPNADAAIRVLPGVNGVTITGVELYAQSFVYNVVVIGGEGAAQDTSEEAPRNITLDRVWIHGAATEHSQNGIVANGVNVSVTNSRIDDIHGVGVESHGIVAWNGPGPFLIADNHIEAAAINIMFGGAVPSIPNLIPGDIEILRNHLFKPLSWKVGHPSYAGIHWSIKNLLELKMARNVLIDRNVLENSWADAQIGYAVLFTVRGEDGKAPWATIVNVSFTNNIVDNTEQGFQLLGEDDSGPSVRGSGLLIHNNSFPNITNRFFTMTAFDNVTLSHNTHLQGGLLMSLYGKPSFGFRYVNNATFRAPESFGVHGDGVGEGSIAFETYTPGSVVEGNVLAGAQERFYPPNNFFPPDLSTLSSFTGTDGLVPGFLGLPTSSPSPEPTPTVEPSPSPSPTATPSPTPMPVPATRTVIWPNSKAKQNIIADEQWTERFRFKKNLSGQFAEFEKVN